MSEPVISDVKKIFTGIPFCNGGASVIVVVLAEIVRRLETAFDVIGFSFIVEIRPYSGRT